MSVLVKGMEMPTCCCWCPFCRKTYTEWGSIYSADCIIKKMPIKFSELDLRDGLCPLVEVPPHGRLIDADALLKRLDSCMFPSDMVTTRAVSMATNWIKEAPTVIPADKDGEI